MAATVTRTTTTVYNRHLAILHGPTCVVDGEPMQVSFTVGENANVSIAYLAEAEKKPAFKRWVEASMLTDDPSKSPRRIPGPPRSLVPSPNEIVLPGTKAPGSKGRDTVHLDKNASLAPAKR